MNHSEKFIRSLKVNNIEALRRIPKADLHNHFYLGGNKEYIYKKTGKKIPSLNYKLNSMDEMHSWVNKNIGNVFEGKKGRILALEASFAQAIHDGITILEIGEDIWANGYFYDNNVEELLNVFNSIHNMIAANIDLRLQIGLSRHCKIKDLEEWIEPFWDYDCFYSIDLYGDEMAQPIERFKGIYRKAKEKGLILKAHVGEWGDADSVKRAVSELELDEVQHGISASQSQQVMNWLSDHNIQLNVCPTSNVMLGRVESIAKHPIRKLFDNGIKVTINSDDVLIFNSPVSEEYIKLFQGGVFTATELDIIRLNGLN
ncbi:amidohydrolase family protein [Vallitalea guaymasensis]|uniref:Adenosine deaminase n=1 Tax=Vallitalea guaymasensis TaxID=1185412 RepID=A0A8J8SBD1_9FIRM|nr:adenosine deaminase [Vallitalea guaymasensis]QUH28524.1 adenosine deaminase [Vallitalea guaymasensis]